MVFAVIAERAYRRGGPEIRLRRLQITRVAPRPAGHGVPRVVPIVPTDVRPNIHDAVAIFGSVWLHLKEPVTDINLDEILVVVAQRDVHRDVGRLAGFHGKANRMRKRLRYGRQARCMEPDLIVAWCHQREREPSIGVGRRALSSLFTAPCHQNEGAEAGLGCSVQRLDETGDVPGCGWLDDAAITAARAT